MALEIGMLLYPGVTQLDLTGPYEVLSRIDGARVHLLWKDTAPVASDSGMRILPELSLRDAPALNIVFVPGGPGQIALMDDEEVLAFLRSTSASARYVTSVCTGSLVLAAAGLLQGYRAACHWMWRGELARLGVEVSTDRVVIDRNRVTGGGITAGIDFALALAAELAGPDEAQRIQLQMEYNPAPPFDSGSPEAATSAIILEAERRAAKLRKPRREATDRAASRLGLGYP
jgi:cyclohexyl-isocyanide hydratase